MSVRRSLFLAYGSQIVTLILSFLTSVVVARMISPREMGVYALAIAVSGVLSVFLSFGPQSFVVKEDKIDIYTVRSAYTVNGILSIILATCLFSLGLFNFYIENKREIASIFLIMAAGPIFSSLEFVPAALFMREMRYSVISTVNIMRAIVIALVTITLVWLGAGAPGLAIGPVIANLVCAIVYIVLRPKDIVIRPGFHRFKEIFVFGLQMLSISGVAQLAARSADIILGSMLGLVALGLYARASGLATLIFVNVYGLATSVIFVQMSRDLREEGQLRTTFLRALRMLTAVMWPILLGIATLSGPIILNVYGEKWLPAAQPLSLLMLAQFIVLSFGMNWELFVLRKENSKQVWIEVTRAVLGTLVFVFGCMFNLTAASAGRVFEAIIGYILYKPHVSRLAGAKAGEVENILIESLLLAAVAVVPSVILMGLYEWSAHAPLASIFLAVVGGIIAWFALLKCKRHPVYYEIEALCTRFGKFGR